MTRKCTCAVLAISLLISIHPAARSGERFPGKELDSFIETFLEWYAIPGLSVAVVQNDSITYARSWGVENIDTRENVTTRTLFSTASVTKLFVATAVMQLVEKDLVALDAPVANYLPYFQMKDERYKTITIRQMLSHTSGMPDTEREEFYTSWRHPEYDEDALERYVRSLRDIPLANTPGEHSLYSNMAFDVLGDLIAKVSGLAFEDYVQKHILDPLGMESSTILYKAVDSTLIATPHLMSSDLEYEVSDIFPYSRRHPACGTLFSNVLDMSRWAVANINRGELDGKRILRESSYEVMWSPAVLADNSFGLGWMLEEFGSYRMYSHGGGDPGFRTEFYILPEESVGVVVMTNSWDEDINPIAMKALNLVLGEWEVDWFAFFRGTLWQNIRETGVDSTLEKCRQLTREYGKDNFHPAILNQIGNRLAGIDRTEEACRLFELNVEYYPTIYQLLNNLADAYLKLGKKDLALESCQKSLQVKPGNEGAVRILKALRKPDE
ncbi:MAG: serine hydrolase [Candidatus Latescibacteria bacterium]|nr:serine hydrolase [Candidatus Latescibacterota bacterium]NIM66180.1 serine hydrolase [Candidatus Latescibacterota bacterium]NIO29499.1 serine hydrolase [Candidatus Latescibacterota bacterium]NIO57213.1 serine hydrolase [Candidatus Latescibacterota bacterium]NIT03076.1 serine hydrolase [Candidatus Latescibacterota bacterium]